jgi:hypothetical protein
MPMRGTYLLCSAESGSMKLCLSAPGNMHETPPGFFQELACAVPLEWTHSSHAAGENFHLDKVDQEKNYACHRMQPAELSEDR